MRGRNLAAQLGADRPAAPGHQDHPVFQGTADSVPIEPHRIAAEQVLDGDRVHLADGHLPRHQIPQRWNGTVGLLGPLAQLYKALHLLGRRAGNCQQDQIHGQLCDQLRNRGRCPADRNTVQLAAASARLVVHKGHGEIGRLRISQHIPDQHLPGAAGPHDQDPLRVMQGQSVILQLPVEQARAGQQQHL